MTDRPGQPERYRCSTDSAERAEPLLGTASVVHTWLLLEHAGPWAPKALASARLAPGIGTELARSANRHRVRVVLIRRPGRTEPDLRPACFAAITRAGGSWLGRIDLDRPEDVLDVDLASLASGSQSQVELVDGPLLCVCTHGRHDTCCAERGRPVAAALATRFPEATWEVSHIGGDRFAGNVVCFPGGDYFGRIDQHNAVPVLESYLAGTYDLDHLRGRAGVPTGVQAAEILLRRELGVDGRDDVRVLGVRWGQDDLVADLDVHGHGELAVHVRIGAVADARTLTCTAANATQPPSYELLSIKSVG